MKRKPRIYYSASQKALMWDRWQKLPVARSRFARNYQRRRKEPNTDVALHTGLSANAV